MLTARRAGVVAAIAAALLTAGCGGSAPVPAPAPAPAGTAAAPTQPGRQDAFNLTDVTFLQLMVAHHEQALEMAKLAGTRAASPEVRAVAQGALDTQPAEINTMGRWLLSLGIDPAQISPASAHAHAGGMTEQDVVALGGLSGAEFDHRFLDLMIKHSLGASGMAREEAQTGENTGVLTLAGRIGQRESDRVLQMQRLL